MIALQAADRCQAPCGWLRGAQEELVMDAMDYPNIDSYRIRSVTVHERDL
jgi:hypothetical protein